MEEEMIKKSFCNYCINKGNNCLEIQIQEKNGIKMYKCVNYNKQNTTFFRQNQIE